MALTKMMIEKNIRRPLNDKDIILLYNACDSIRMKILIVFLYLTGARISEALDIRRDDIIIREPYIYIKLITKKKRKINKGQQRTIPIRLDNKFLKPFLKYLNIREWNGTDRLFHMNRSTAWRNLMKTSKKCGWSEGLWLHFFRHSTLSRLANRGATANELKRIAGWSSIVYADIYVHDDINMARNTADKDVPRKREM